MKVLNNITEKGTEELSNILQEAFESRNGSIETFPLIFIVQELRNYHTGEPVIYEMYGLTNNPVMLYNERDKHNINVLIGMSGNRHFMKINGEFRAISGNISLSSKSIIIDAEKYIQEEIERKGIKTEIAGDDYYLKLLLGPNPNKVQLPKGEHITYIYIGEKAYDCLAKSEGFNDT